LSIAVHACALASYNDAPAVIDTIARQVHLQLGVPIAAVLEPKSLKLVVTGRQHYRVSLYVTPRVARGVLCAVDADKRSETVVSVHTEGVGSSVVVPERDSNVESDGNIGSHGTHHLVAKILRGAKRSVTVAIALIVIRLCTRLTLRTATERVGTTNLYLKHGDRLWSFGA